jgi:hypothetical protein
MTIGSNKHEKMLKIGKEKPDCKHGAMYMSGRYDEYRLMYRDRDTGEEVREWVTIEVWECPGCGMVEYIDD